MVALLHELFPWALAFFVLNSFALVGARRRLLVSWNGEPHRLERRRLAAPGLWPACEAIAPFEPRLWLTATGLIVPRGGGLAPPDAEELVEIPWARLADARAEGSRVKSDAGEVLRAPTPETAAALAARVRGWARAATGAERMADLEAWLQERLRVDLVRERRRRQRERLGPLRLASTIAFASGFVALPASLYLPEQPGALALGAFALALLAALAAAVAAARMLAAAGLGRAATRRALEPLLFYPPLAAHAPSFAARHLYADFAPLAVVAALAGPEDVRRVAAEEWLEIDEGLARTDPARLGDYWRVRREVLSAWLRSVGLGEGDALLTRERQDPLAVVYCPACGAEYRRALGRCGDCDVALRDWGPAALSSSAGRTAPGGGSPPCAVPAPPSAPGSAG